MEYRMNFSNLKYRAQVTRCNASRALFRPIYS